MAWLRSSLTLERLESRWIMGQSEVARPRRVSTLPEGEVAPRESRGGSGEREPLPGAEDSGAVPKERAAMTS